MVCLPGHARPEGGRRDARHVCHRQRRRVLLCGGMGRERGLRLARPAELAPRGQHRVRRGTRRAELGVAALGRAAHGILRLLRPVPEGAAAQAGGAVRGGDGRAGAARRLVGPEPGRPRARRGHGGHRAAAGVGDSSAAPRRVAGVLLCRGPAHAPARPRRRGRRRGPADGAGVSRHRASPPRLPRSCLPLAKPHAAWLRSYSKASPSTSCRA